MASTYKSAAATACAPSRPSSSEVVKTGEAHQHFHLSSFPPNSNWPAGGWSLYRITGEQIAERIVRNAEGEVVERWPWPGYIGCFETLAEVTEAING